MKSLLPTIDGKIVKVKDENGHVWTMVTEPKYEYTDNHFLDDVVGTDVNGKDIYDEFPADVYTALVVRAEDSNIIPTFIEIMVLQESRIGNAPKYSDSIENSNIVYINLESTSDTGEKFLTIECCEMIKEEVSNG